MSGNIGYEKVQSVAYADSTALPLVSAIAFGEPMATKALNRQFHNVLEHGIYKGFDYILAGGFDVLVASNGDQHTLVSRHSDVTLSVHGQHPATLTIPTGGTFVIVIESSYEYGVKTKQVDHLSDIDAAAYKVLPIADVLDHHVVVIGFDVPADATALTSVMINVDLRQQVVAGSGSVKEHEAADNPHLQYERADNAATDSDIDAKSKNKKHVKLSQLWRALESIETGPGEAHPPINLDPTDDSLIPTRGIWLIDTATSATQRLLPPANSDVAIGSRIKIRDDAGNCAAVNAKLLRNGNTIMGSDGDLLIETDWAWCELLYVGNNDWRIDSGGIGAEVRKEYDIVEIIEKIYPAGAIYITFNDISPASHLGVGVWQKTSEGRALFGVGGSVGEDGRNLNIVAKGTGGVVGTKLTENHIPKHSFKYDRQSDGRKTSGSGGSHAAALGKSATNTSSYGAKDPKVIPAVPPYMGIYVWTRTA